MHRHTITVTVVIDSTSADSAHTAEALLGHITNCQDYDLSAEDDEGNERFALQMHVASAEAQGIKIEAAWAVRP